MEERCRNGFEAREAVKHVGGSIGRHLWVSDTREADSPYKSAVILEADLPDGIDFQTLDSEHIGLEFRLEKNTREDPPFQAKDCKVIHL